MRWLCLHIVTSLYEVSWTPAANFQESCSLYTKHCLSLTYYQEELRGLGPYMFLVMMEGLSISL